LQSGLAEKGDDRIVAIRVLGLLENNAKAAEIATAALADEKPEARAAAADALGQMHAKSALPKLKEIIKTDKEPSVVIAGARALIALGDPLGYAVYYAVLTGEKKSGGGLLDDQKKMLKDPKKMAQFGFEQGIGFIPFASVGLGAFKALTKDDSSPVRAAAARILANDPDPKSGDALIEASSDEKWLVRAAALDALSHRGDPSAIPKIESKLDDEKEAVRYAAAATIIHLQDVQASGVGRKKK
jgi:HEAT repeat protein